MPNTTAVEPKGKVHIEVEKHDKAYHIKIATEYFPEFAKRISKVFAEEGIKVEFEIQESII